MPGFARSAIGSDTGKEMMDNALFHIDVTPGSPETELPAEPR